MLVKKGDVLLRSGTTYEVVCCDEEVFIVGKREYIPEERVMRTHYDDLEAYSNDAAINSLSELNFAKRIKPEKWVD